MFLQLDGTFWVQLINFGIFYLILRVVFLKPVGDAVRKRREYIDGVQNDFQTFTRRSRELRAEGDARRAGARREAEEQVLQARGAADTEAQKIAAGFTTEANTIADDARAKVDAELASARSREPELAAALGRDLLDRAIGALRR